VVDTSNIHTDSEILASDHLLTASFQQCYCMHFCSSLNIFNDEKSVGGHVKKSITLFFFNRITFYLVFI